VALRGLGAFLAAIILALASLPYWMGYALQALAPEDIVTIGKYETHGYGRFKLSDIEIVRGGITLEIDQVEAPTPLNWIYRAMMSGFDAYVVEVGSVIVEVDDTAQKETDPNASAPKDLFEAMNLLERPLALTHVWIPSARIERATINASGQSIELRHIVWRDLSLELEAIYADRPESPASIAAELGTQTVSFTAAIPNEALSWQGQLEVGSETKATVINEIAYQENRLTLEADFGAGSWLPQRAEWRADSWQINGEEFGLDILYTDFGFDFSRSINKPYSRFLRQDIVRTLRNLYHTHGYPEVSITSSTNQNKVAEDRVDVELVLTVTPGPLVTVSGISLVET